MGILVVGLGVSLARAADQPTLPGAGGGLVGAADLKWGTNPDQALAQAREEGKPIYVYIWAKYDSECIAMADETLTYDQVTNQLAGFVLLALDAHNRASFPFFDHYKIPYIKLEGLGGDGEAGTPTTEGNPVAVPTTGASRWPTSLFLDASGQEAYRLFGYMPGKAFAPILAQVREVLKARELLQREPDSVLAEAQLGHLYTSLSVFPEARTHLERALQLDPQNHAGVRPDVTLDLTIISLPSKPQVARQELRTWQKDNARHPRVLEACYYEAVADTALYDPGAAGAPGGDTTELQAAAELLTRFKDAKPGTPEYNSQWYVPALTLLAKINLYLQPPTPARH
jgi:tetratricopeptide (TPR) repeat protein